MSTIEKIISALRIAETLAIQNAKVRQPIQDSLDQLRHSTTEIMNDVLNLQTAISRELARL